MLTVIMVKGQGHSMRESDNPLKSMGHMPVNQII